jgi:REP element-mobilizing transposase RayT
MTHDIATAFTSNSAGASAPVALEHLHHVCLEPVAHSPVLCGHVAAELPKVFMEIAANSGYRIISVSISPDHVNLLVELDPMHRPESVTRELRGLSSLRLMQSFPGLRLRLRANHLWI